MESNNDIRAVDLLTNAFQKLPLEGLIILCSMIGQDVVDRETALEVLASAVAETQKVKIGSVSPKTLDPVAKGEPFFMFCHPTEIMFNKDKQFVAFDWTVPNIRRHILKVYKDFVKSFDCDPRQIANALIPIMRSFMSHDDLVAIIPGNASRPKDGHLHEGMTNRYNAKGSYKSIGHNYMFAFLVVTTDVVDNPKSFCETIEGYLHDECRGDPKYPKGSFNSKGRTVRNQLSDLYFTVYIAMKLK